jgi:K+-sensing histidine kinase KdpD
MSITLGTDARRRIVGEVGKEAGTDLVSSLEDIAVIVMGEDQKPKEKKKPKKQPKKKSPKKGK